MLLFQQPNSSNDPAQLACLALLCTSCQVSTHDNEPSAATLMEKASTIAISLKGHSQADPELASDVVRVGAAISRARCSSWRPSEGLVAPLENRQSLEAAAASTFSFSCVNFSPIRNCSCASIQPSICTGMSLSLSRRAETADYP